MDAAAAAAATPYDRCPELSQPLREKLGRAALAMHGKHRSWCQMAVLSVMKKEKIPAGVSKRKLAECCCMPPPPICSINVLHHSRNVQADGAEEGEGGGRGGACSCGGYWDTPCHGGGDGDG